MSTAIKMVNCSDMVMNNIRTEGFDIGIDAKDVKGLSLQNYISNDRQALNFSNVSGNVSNITLLFQDGKKLSDIAGAEVAHKAVRDIITQGSIPYSDKEYLLACLNEVFDSNEESNLENAKDRFLGRAANYASVLGFAFDLIKGIAGGG